MDTQLPNADEMSFLGDNMQLRARRSTEKVISNLFY